MFQIRLQKTQLKEPSRRDTHPVPADSAEPRGRPSCSRAGRRRSSVDVSGKRRRRSIPCSARWPLCLAIRLPADVPGCSHNGRSCRHHPRAGTDAGPCGCVTAQQGPPASGCSPPGGAASPKCWWWNTSGSFPYLGVSVPPSSFLKKPCSSSPRA